MSSRYRHWVIGKANPDGTWDVKSVIKYQATNWDNYEYYFDTAYCERRPELYGSIIHIYEKATGEEIWKIGVGMAGRETLENLMQ